MSAKGVDFDNLLLILLGILLAYGVAIEKTILNAIRVESFLGMLFSLQRLLHHIHDYLLEVIQSDKLVSDGISIVVVIILFKQQ